MTTFEETGLKKELIKAISAMGFETPTPIQTKTIPHLLNNSGDLIALAQTGTGKTAAFGLPAIHLTDTDNYNTQTIILCPTRELCLQITKDLTAYGKHVLGLHIVAVYGGSSIEKQIKELNRGAHIVVGTPGRVKDLIKRRRLKLGNIERVILDEADEMLSMGFKDDLDEILAKTPAEKQTLLFSATMSKGIKSVTKKYMNNPEEIAVAALNQGADTVMHKYYVVAARNRYEVLKRLADINPDIYAIVFCRTRRETQEVANKLMNDGYSADALHGDMSQGQRDDVMGRFRTKQLQMLVATDVAARGLDVDDLTHVINYNLPDSDESYIHRSGRTGRAGKEGISIAIVHTRETRRIRDIEKISKIKFEKELVPSGRDICEKQLFSLIDKVKEIDVNEKQIAPFLPGIYDKLSSLTREELIQHFVSAEFNRFLAYYKNAADINAVEGKGKDRKERTDKRDRNDRKERGGRNRNSGVRFTRLFINVGSKNNLTPARLMGVINELLKDDDMQIGKIEILKKFSFFEIEEHQARPLINVAKGVDFEGVAISIEESQGGPDRTTKKVKPSKRRSGDRNSRNNNSEGRGRRKNTEGRSKRRSKPKSTNSSQGGNRRRRNT